ncbi:S1 RNA-binding domain-containing protein [Humisphaera borealis]|uniref:S1 RNA-binding domain-containing protein n=1 Tax=Humisphaera borealis TaxID=2807512 RepID=A0A7M2WVL8_9BACT|nr:S1 RNA-binding domain-containing protein [Humisphaera borealis]QOV89597.1 S1 RNA-binding domain-containing protein [Humisphaera borealis]
MAEDLKADPFKEKFRADESALDSELNAALTGVEVDSLYGFDKPQPAAATPTEGPREIGGKQVRHGKIVSISKDEAFVEFGGKSQGIVPLIQFAEPPVVGQEQDFLVERYDVHEGVILLSVKGASAANVSWENLEAGQIVEGTVTGMNKGGLEIDVKGMRGFMPAGQIDIYFHKDISVFLGQKMQAEVTKFERAAKNLVLSRRNILEREKEEKKKVLMAELAPGQMRQGTVRSVMDFGAFVDLGGADGLIHVSEMSHRRGVKPSDFVKEGDLVDVKIIKMDAASGKISLSLKQAMPDPWGGIENRYAVGTLVTGRVAKVENFGAFIEVEEGIEGLLPVSEMSWTRIRHPSDVVKAGDTIKLSVIRMDPAARKMTFSLKAAGPDPWATAKEKYPPNTIITGKVTRAVDFGAFVEVEAGLEGLVHISELAPHRVKQTGDVVKPGQEIQARVLDIDLNARRMSLSIRRVAEEPPPPPTPVDPAAVAAAAAAAEKKKKKRAELKGGLDWNW